LWLIKEGYDATLREYESQLDSCRTEISQLLHSSSARTLTVAGHLDKLLEAHYAVLWNGIRILSRAKAAIFAFEESMETIEFDTILGMMDKVENLKVDSCSKLITEF